MTKKDPVEEQIEENAKAAGAREAALATAIASGGVLGLFYKGKEFQSGKMETLPLFRFPSVNGREIDVIERKPGEWHVLIWQGGVLEDSISYHRDPTVVVAEVQNILGQARISRGQTALKLMQTFGAVVQDSIDMQKGLK
jgi:hypothetical protein